MPSNIAFELGVKLNEGGMELDFYTPSALCILKDAKDRCHFL